jgi:O-antigen/teichoic acid export membrane protein
MFNSLKYTLKHSVIYGLGNISSKLIGFVLLPLYTKYLTVDEYGMLAILDITSQFLVSIFSLNIGTAMMRWSADTKDEVKQKTIIFTTLIATIAISIILLIIVLPFTDDLSYLFFSSDKFSDYILLLFITSSFGIYNLFPLTLMRLREKSSMFAILNTTRLVITLVFNVFFMAYINLGIDGILISLLIGQIFLSIATIPLIRRNIVFKFEFDILKDMIGYGLPLIFTTVFSLLLTMSDRFVIKYFYGDRSVGIYSLGNKIASVINILILQSFQLGFLPIAYKKLGSADAQRFFSKTLTYFTFFLIISALGISLFSKELLIVLAQKKDYLASFSVIPLISFGFVLRGIQYMFSLSFHYSKRTTYNAVIVIVSAVINIFLNIYLVQKFEFIGAAYAMLISTIIMVWLSYFYGQKVYHIDYEMKKLILLIVAGILTYLVSIYLSQFSFYLGILLKLILLILFPFILVPLKFYESAEIKRIKQSWTKWRNPFNWKENLKQIKMLK